MLGPRRGGEALIIDPVLEKVMGELELNLVKAVIHTFTPITLRAPARCAFT